MKHLYRALLVSTVLMPAAVALRHTFSGLRLSLVRVNRVHADNDDSKLIAALYAATTSGVWRLVDDGLP